MEDKASSDPSPDKENEAATRAQTAALLDVEFALVRGTVRTSYSVAWTVDDQAEERDLQTGCFVGQSRGSL